MTDRVMVIAEAGVNHNGDLGRALALVDAAADAGADAVKFQTFDPKALVTGDAPQADYQVRNQGDAGSQRAMLEKLALGHNAHHALLEHCAARGINFLSSPFDTGSADFLLNDLELPLIKLGSGELTNGPLLLHVAKRQPDIILSTGMATLVEIREALAVIAHGLLDRDIPTESGALTALLERSAAQTELRQRVTLLHCTTEYPCPIDQVNLRAMDTLHDTFGLPVGYSDHTLGITVSLAAAARGATVIEKHFTLDRQLPGPDHVASLEPDELTALVHGVRDISQALGNPDKQPAAVELANAAVARKSLVAARPIRAGEPFTADNLTVKRPGTGRSPMAFWELLGKPAERDYRADEVIT